MAHMLIRHQVADYKKWRPAFNDHLGARQAAGLKDLYVWHNENDPNDLTLLFEVSSEEQAKKFADSSDLKEKMQEAGVKGPPEILFLLED